MRHSASKVRVAFGTPFNSSGIRHQRCWQIHRQYLSTISQYSARKLPFSQSPSPPSIKEKQYRQQLPTPSPSSKTANANTAYQHNQLSESYQLSIRADQHQHYSISDKFYLSSPIKSLDLASQRSMTMLILPCLLPCAVGLWKGDTVLWSEYLREMIHRLSPYSTFAAVMPARISSICRRHHFSPPAIQILGPTVVNCATVQRLVTADFRPSSVVIIDLKHQLTSPIFAPVFSSAATAALISPTSG